MPLTHPAAAKLKQQFPAIGLKGSEFLGDTQIIVPKEHFTAVVTFLKNEVGYDMLSDVSCVDYLNFAGAPEDGKFRFGVIYIFNSITAGLPKLILRVFMNEPDLTVDSLVPLFAGAEWLERECWDMFGIKFKNHPDLRRILTWETFGSHPLRKDYPVTGKGEREAYPILSRDSA